VFNLWLQQMSMFFSLLYITHLGDFLMAAL